MWHVPGWGAKGIFLWCPGFRATLSLRFSHSRLGGGPLSPSGAAQSLNQD